MLRHKALIQCARVAFGFSGVYDEDDARQIGGMVDVTPVPAAVVDKVEPKQEPAPQAPSRPISSSTKRPFRCSINLPTALLPVVLNGLQSLLKLSREACSLIPHSYQ